MYRCFGCGGDVENINGQCLCGKTTTDHKGRVMGEKFTKIPGQPIYGRTKVRTCPKCGWEGLVIPRLGVGCPDHGVWYKDVKEKYTSTIKEEEETDDTKPKRSERRDFRRRGAAHGQTRRYG